MSLFCFFKLFFCLKKKNFFQEDDVETPFGNIHVAIQGDRSKQAIITYHDIGLNRKLFSHTKFHHSSASDK